MNFFFLQSSIEFFLEGNTNSISFSNSDNKEIS